MNYKTKSKRNTHMFYNFICKPLANYIYKIMSLILNRYKIRAA